MSRLERDDVQGLVVSGYGRSMPMSRFLVLRVDDPARARPWAAQLADRVTAGAKPEELRCINVAFTAAGLAALGLGQEDLRSFPLPFREGMVVPHRQRILGDTEASDPARWAWGGTGPAPAVAAADVHALLLLYGRDEAAFDALVEDETTRLAAGGLSVVHTITPLRLPGPQEHRRQVRGRALRLRRRHVPAGGGRQRAGGRAGGRRRPAQRHRHR